MNEALLTVWQLWDIIYYRCTRLVYVDKRNDNIFRVVIKRYWGAPLKVEEQDVISTGDYYVKLHIHNCQLARRLRGTKSDMRLGLVALNEIRKSLPALARYITEHPDTDKIEGIVGTTILYRGARRLGFHVQDIESPLYRGFKTVFFKFILCMCHPSGLDRIRNQTDKLAAKRVFMSKDELLSRYLGE